LLLSWGSWDVPFLLPSLLALPSSKLLHTRRLSWLSALDSGLWKVGTSRYYEEKKKDEMEHFHSCQLFFTFPFANWGGEGKLGNYYYLTSV
jgi:hypothetical protein